MMKLSGKKYNLITQNSENNISIDFSPSPYALLLRIRSNE